MRSSSYFDTSAPATKALPPAPDSTITRTSGSASKRSTASPMPCHISSEIAFSLSGLLNTMWATAPSRRVRILSVMAGSLSGESGGSLVGEGGERLAVVGGFVGQRLERGRELQHVGQARVLGLAQQALHQPQRLRRVGRDALRQRMR